MDVGANLRAARTDAQRTQEQAAEALGVSRQTISNWENSRTYPDIISVIRMSELYGVSLDCLLKGGEETVTPGYMDYLEESTNAVRGTRRLTRIILLSVYLGIWAFSVTMFWTCMSPSDAGAFSLVFLYLLLPVTTFVLSLLLGTDRGWDRRRWLLAPAAGVMYMLAEYATFSLANMLAFDRLNAPSVGMLLAGIVISLAGMGAGTLIRRRHKAR